MPVMMDSTLRLNEAKASAALSESMLLALGSLTSGHRGSDLPTLRSAAYAAASKGPEEVDARWWQWLLDLGDSANLRLKTIDATVDEVFGLVRLDAPVATYLKDEQRWLVLKRVRGRRIDADLIGSDVKTFEFRRKDLAARLPAGIDGASRRWVVLDGSGITDPPTSGGGDDDGHHHDEPTPFARLWTLLRPEMSDLWVVFVFAVFVGLLALATPIAVEALVNTVAFGRFLQPIVILSLMLFGFLVFAASMRALQTYVVEIIQRRLFVRVAADLAWRLPRVRHGAHDRHYSAELVNRFLEVATVQKVTAQLLLDGVTIVLGTFIGMAVLAFYHPWLLGFDLFLLATIALIVFVLGRGAVGSAIKESKHKYQMVGWLEETLRCPIAFKMSGGAGLAAERADHIAAEYLAARQSHFRVLMRQIIFALALQAVASTVLLGLGGWLVVSGQLTLGQLVAAELIVAVIVGSFAKFGKHLEAFYDLMAAVDKLGILFDLPTERSAGVSLSPRSGAPVLVAKNLSCRDAGGRTKPNGIDLTIEAGEVVGLSGPFASGKSTLVDLIYGLRSPTEGSLAVCGVDLRDARRSVLRQYVALARDVEVFEGTILQNVSLGRQDTDLSDVRHLLERVGLLDEVMQLPDGLETRLTSAGAPLAQTQARRLMLARALAVRPSLLLIDGLLDTLPDETAAELLTAIKREDPNISVLVVSARTSLFPHCSRQVTLDARGRLVSHANSN